MLAETLSTLLFFSVGTSLCSWWEALWESHSKWPTLSWSRLFHWMLCLCVFTLYFLVPVHSVRMEVNLGYSNTKKSGKHRGTGVVHMGCGGLRGGCWDSLLCLGQMPVYCVLLLQWELRYMKGGFHLTPTRSLWKSHLAVQILMNVKCNVLLRARQGQGHSIKAGALNAVCLLD